MTQKSLSALNREGGRARQSDEYYTLYENVDAELSHYARFLRGKRIHLPCDSPKSAFVKWFKDHPELGCKVTYSWTDYHLPENQRQMAEQDIIITNPPYSLIRDFLSILSALDKKFIVVMNVLGLQYVGIREQWFQGRIRPGFTRIVWFRTPDGTIKPVKQSVWATNLPVRNYTPIRYHDAPLSSYQRDIVTGAIEVPGIKYIPNTKQPIMLPCTEAQFRQLDPRRYNMLQIAHNQAVIENGKRKNLFKRVLVKKI